VTEKGSSKTLLVFLAAMICCALPFLLIIGGTTFLVGILSQELILTLLGLLFMLIIIWIYLEKKANVS